MHAEAIGRRLQKHADFSVCKGWIDNCSTTHESCRPIEDKPLPKRVIDSGSNDLEPRLVETEGIKGLYVTLSHCWGGAHPLMTTTENYQDHLGSVALATLQRTFHDFIVTTRRLCYRFLWIDSLCIIQGPGGDWADQCGRMDHIFEQCAFTIGASAALDTNTGFLHARKTAANARCPFPDPTGTDQLSLDIPNEGFIHYDTDDGNKLGTPMRSRAQLLSGAWVMQERPLSPRTLYFGTYEMYYQCRSAAYHESQWSEATVLWEKGTDSWAACPEPVHFNTYSLDYEPCIHIDRLDIVPEAAGNPFGRVKHGYLVATGRMQKLVTIRRPTANPVALSVLQLHDTDGDIGLCILDIDTFPQADGFEMVVDCLLVQKKLYAHDLKWNGLALQPCEPGSSTYRRIGLMERELLTLGGGRGLSRLNFEKVWGAAAERTVTIV
ncbi:uncharacterized protein JN550_003654 [Neoarthrinium moseri]|uniref:uncharacterized protein n=1 Tax=Neoarthrinium moseri TaxID=1658444 RepID=UPI001FDB877C|nr:uncharacterized protein JN550_003654 [Neoarthrinium moseri]KAI1872780.1 hypothetical protein JN550_003654 [Neoarthrinium moseri]